MKNKPRNSKKEKRRWGNSKRMRKVDRPKRRKGTTKGRKCKKISSKKRKKWWRMSKGNLMWTSLLLLQQSTKMTNPNPSQKTRMLPPSSQPNPNRKPILIKTTRTRIRLDWITSRFKSRTKICRNFNENNKTKKRICLWTKTKRTN